MVENSTPQTQKTEKYYDYGHLHTPFIVTKLQKQYYAIAKANGVDLNTISLNSPTYFPGTDNGKGGLKGMKPLGEIVWEQSKKQQKNGVWKGLRLLELEQVKPRTAEGVIDDTERIIRWCTVSDFNPGSSSQLLKYLKWRIKTLSQSVRVEDQKLAKLYYVPRNFKDGRETTSSKELKELLEKTGDPLLQSVMDYRSISTNLNNYYPNWEPNPETGCVHPTFGYVPPGGQTNTVDPNSQNLSKHTYYGQIFRRMVQAKKGHVFVEFDKSRFHVAMMGREAQSARYIRFARLDSHSIFTSWVIGVKELEVDIDNDSDEVIKAKTKEIKANKAWKEARDKENKATVLGNQLGLGARKMYFMNRKRLRNIAHAESLQRHIAGRFPECENWKKWITMDVDVKRYYLTEFGYIRHFYDVLRPKWNKSLNQWDKEPQHGDDYEKVLALPIQSNSFCMLKEEWLKMINRYDAFNRYNFINTIHDSNVFHPEITKLEECIKNVFLVMNEPCVEMANKACPEGLVVGAGVSVGRNMQNWNDKTDGEAPYNPEGMREINVVIKDGEVKVDWEGLGWLQ